MSKPETLKIDEVEYVKKDSIKKQVIVPKGDESNPFMETGKVYFIRTVTHYFTGRLLWVGEKELAFEDACWIADTGRFNEFLKSKDNVSESEPFPQGSILMIGRGSLIDMVEYNAGLILGVK